MLLLIRSNYVHDEQHLFNCVHQAFRELSKNIFLADWEDNTCCIFVDSDNLQKVYQVLNKLNQNVSDYYQMEIIDKGSDRQNELEAILNSMRQAQTD